MENPASPETPVQNIDVATQNRGGKYLTFRLADEEYGIEILRVTTIIRMLEITTVPDTPAYVRGVINLRGKVIPVVDMRLKFNLGQTADTKETCIIVIDVQKGTESRQTGIIVDSVSEVLYVDETNIENAPEFDEHHRDDILGIAKINDTIKILLDIDCVLGNAALSNL